MNQVWGVAHDGKFHPRLGTANSYGKKLNNITERDGALFFIDFGSDLWTYSPPRLPPPAPRLPPPAPLAAAPLPAKPLAARPPPLARTAVPLAARPSAIPRAPATARAPARAMPPAAGGAVPHQPAAARR
jgi:hypothetical protein